MRAVALALVASAAAEPPKQVARALARFDAVWRTYADMVTAADRQLAEADRELADSTLLDAMRGMRKALSLTDEHLGAFQARMGVVDAIIEHSLVQLTHSLVQLEAAWVLIGCSRTWRRARRSTRRRSSHAAATMRSCGCSRVARPPNCARRRRGVGPGQEVH